MQTQTETASPRKAQSPAANTRSPAKTSASSKNSSEPKALTEVIGESLGEDTQKQIEEVISQASSYFESGRTYVRENRGEALALATAAGVIGWALLFTKPGRQILEIAAPKILPQISNLISETLGTNVQAKA